MTDPSRSRPVNGTRAVWRTRDVAAFWQRTPTTVMRWVEAGDHPPPRSDPGGQPFWLAAEVEAFARRGCVDGNAPTAAATPTPNGSGGRTPDREDAAALALVIGDGGAS